MKLRIRSLDSKQTLKLELSDTSTVHELKEILSSRLSDGCPVTPNQLFLTLNRKDELSGASLQSHGVTSGDLVFYSINPVPNELSSHTANPSLETDDGRDCNGGEKETVNPVSPRKRAAVPEGCESEDVEEDMEVDHDDDDADDVAILRSLSVPGFLKKVFEDEIGSSSSRSAGTGNVLLNVAVHAVLLESGFVGFDPVSCAKVDGFRLPHGFPSSALHYTIPEVLSSEDGVRTVSVKFQSMGRFVNVVGSLSDKVFVYRVCLDGVRFVPAFNLVWKNGNNASEGIGGDSVLRNPEKDVFEFWKVVKDGIALPLLIDLCESVGLVPPSCFMLLPTDLKLKILELLSGTDIAKVACVCREMRFISSNNALWRQKYEEEFGNDTRSVDTEGSWKIGFSRTWKRRKTNREVGHRLRTAGIMTPHFRLRDPVPFFPIPFGIPHMIGGDYDRLRRPGIFPNPFGRRPMPMHPNCNLGGGGGFNV